LSHLRFTPEEYRTIADLCRRHDLGRRHQPAFRRLLLAALQETCPALAGRLARLRRGEVDLLYRHFRERPAPAPERYELSSEELRTLAAACVTAPFTVRFVRPFRRMLVEVLQEEWPDLALKLAHMSGQQFERLYEQVRQRQ
jgi:hypothetical protein